MRRTDADHAAEALELAAAIDAAARLSEAARSQAFGAAWPAVRATRNRIVHGYVTVDAAIVRATVEQDLPGFHAALAIIAPGGR